MLMCLSNCSLKPVNSDRLFVGPTGVYLLDFFCSGIQFYLLLSPYLCFISLFYLNSTYFELSECDDVSIINIIEVKFSCFLCQIVLYA